jgi:GT2 family glycosyltransferase
LEGAVAVGVEEVVCGRDHLMLICIAKSPMEEKAMIKKPAKDIVFLNGSQGVLQAYENGYTRSQDSLIAYVHDDVDIFDLDWCDRVVAEFDDPTVGLVGFGGALRHGTPDLYKRPYKLTNLARFGYHSNQTDAEDHGKRFTGAMDVAVLDGFVLVVRREVLDKAGGWPVDSPIKFHCYDYWLCCMARRYGYRIRMVGVRCHHHGGGTSTRPEYEEWLRREFGKTDQQVHEEAHRYVWEEFRDVLPWEVKT